MKISENELLKEEHLYEGHIYCISFGKNKLGLYKNNQFYFLDKNSREKTIKYKEASPFAYCSELTTDFNEINSSKNLETYEKEKNKIIGKRPEYTAGFLNKEDKLKLENIFKSKIPEDWRIICHHMTINLGFCKNEYKDFLNTTQKMSCVAFGISEDLEVAAIKLEGNLPSNNEIKHITFAVGNNGKAQYSNKIENWKLLDEKIDISLKVGIFLKNNEIIFSKSKTKTPKL